MTAPDRRTRLDRAHPMLSIRRQCVLLSVSRSGVYRPQPPANDDADLTLMRRIDELSMAWPFLGSRRIMAMLRTEGNSIKCRSKNRQSELRQVQIRCVRSSATVSTKVSAGCSATTASALAPVFSGRNAPSARLRRSASALAQRCSHFTAELTLNSKRSAASRRDAPISTASITRSHKSPE